MDPFYIEDMVERFMRRAKRTKYLYLTESTDEVRYLRIWPWPSFTTVEPRYLELAYLELPLISKWKCGPCFNMKLWQQVTK